MNWQQLQSILWLRWRLSRNQWSRGGALNAAVMIIATVGGIVLGVAGGVAGVLVGALTLAKASPQTLLLVWDGVIGAFLFFWVVGVLAELQRSESIDFGRFLHLPVSLKQVFVLNYIASHLTVSLILFVPAMLGLAVGLAFGMSWRMILMVPLIVGVVFIVTAWTYCLRGWLISLMANQRRRRTIIMVITMSLILVGQLPNLYLNVFHGGTGRHSRTVSVNVDTTSALAGIPPTFLAAHRFVPPLWVGNGALWLSRGTVWPAILGSIGAFVIGALGLMRAYRSTVRFYRGETISKVVPHSTLAPRVPTGKKGFLELPIPFVPEEAAALSLALVRSMMRAPEVKMALGSNLFGIVVLGVTFFSRGIGTFGATGQMFLATGVVAFPFLGLLQLMFNLFGLDRDGFRALVLLPIARKHILLAKNLSFLPLALGIGLILLALAEGVAHLPLALLVAACFQLAAIFFLLSTAGNLVSVLAPYRIAAGSLKPTKAPGKKMLLIVLWQLVFPFAMAPAIIPAGLGMLSEHMGWLSAGLVDLVMSVLLAGLAAGFYWITLGTLGGLLQRREKDVLQAVTQEVE